MSNREEILDRCRRAVTRRFERPKLDDINPLIYNNPLQQFRITSEAMGSRIVDVMPEEDINLIIRNLYPDAVTFASPVPEISVSTVNPDEVSSVRELDHTDVGIVQGEFGVAENGCIWLKQTMKERAVYFICENLVILLPKNKIYSNMHEAYRHVSFNDNGYGVFISGPSKTADIAQVLVTGAQAARSVTILLV